MFEFHIPTIVTGGEDCIRRKSELLTGWGKRALIVTGAHSAQKSGALDDVCGQLKQAGVAYSIFDKVQQNPHVVTCHAGGEAARQTEADFVIGLGGGSPLDAAKAVAAFATHPEREPMGIYDPLVRAPLPVVAIPTTAGTGSECNTYSVLTSPDGLQKRTFKGVQNFPKAAFLDPRYTMSMPPEVTVSTALDAFCHGVESFLSKHDNPAAKLYALNGAKQVWQGLTRFTRDDTGLKTREMLLYGAYFGGVAIQHTGTCFPHPMGYNLSLSNGIPHGTATAIFLAEFVRRTELADREHVGQLYSALGTNFSGLAADLKRYCALSVNLSPDQIAQYVALIRNANNFTNGRHAPLSDDDLAQMYEML